MDDLIEKAIREHLKDDSSKKKVKIEIERDSSTETNKEADKIPSKNSDKSENQNQNNSTSIINVISKNKTKSKNNKMNTEKKSKKLVSKNEIIPQTKTITKTVITTETKEVPNDSLNSRLNNKINNPETKNKTKVTKKSKAKKPTKISSKDSVNKTKKISTASEENLLKVSTKKPIKKSIKKSTRKSSTKSAKKTSKKQTKSTAKKPAKETKLSKDNEILNNNILELNKNIQKLINVLTSAAKQMHENDPVEHKINLMNKDVRQCLDENQKIANGVLALADMIKELKESNGTYLNHPNMPSPGQVPELPEHIFHEDDGIDDFGHFNNSQGSEQFGNQNSPRLNDNFGQGFHPNFDMNSNPSTFPQSQPMPPNMMGMHPMDLHELKRREVRVPMNEMGGLNENPPSTPIPPPDMQQPSPIPMNKAPPSEFRQFKEKIKKLF